MTDLRTGVVVTLVIPNSIAANMRMKQKVWELQEKQKKEQEAALRTNNDEVMSISSEQYL